MRKSLLLLMFSLLMLQGASAQAYKESKYYNPATGRLDYGSSLWSGNYLYHDMYYGLRMGPAFSTIQSDDNSTKASETCTGLNFGVAVGVQLGSGEPLFLETGLYYTRKGGNATSNGDKIKYSMDYIILPVVVKYAFEVADDFSIQPFFGLYGGMGVGGKVKYFDTHTSLSTFGDMFNRFDGGLRFGCGLSYASFYLELNYDLGLTNISHDSFDTAHTRSLMLNVGVNF